MKDVISAIRGKTGSTGLPPGKLIGAECWYDVVDNSTTRIYVRGVRIRSQICRLFLR